MASKNKAPNTTKARATNDNSSNPKQKVPLLHPKKMDVTIAHRLYSAYQTTMRRGLMQCEPDEVKVLVNLTVNGKLSSDEFVNDLPVSSVFKKSVPPGLKPIFVSQMDEGKEWVYRKRILHLILIEDPMFGFNATNLAAQDGEGGVIRVSIYETPQDEKYRRLLAFGTQLAIMNPYHRIAIDGKNGIRVEEPDQIVHLGRKENMCRYCGGETLKGSVPSVRSTIAPGSARSRTGRF